VIIVTGAEDDDGSKQAALTAGASDFITKPFQSIQLLARAKAQSRQQLAQQALRDSETDRQQLEQRSHIDTLTGLANEARFSEQLEISGSYARRHGTELALLLLKVDRYKVMFLRHGKEAAEAVLKRVAQILGGERRREDLAARIDLDTFAVVLPSTDATGAAGIAMRLQDAIRSHAFSVHGENIRVSASIAVASRTPQADDDDAPGLLQIAMRNLQEAVMAGGNRILPCPPDAATGSLPADGACPSAGIADVALALRTIAAGKSPQTSATSLVLAILPLLRAWNREQGNRHAGLIEALETALATGAGPPAARIPADTL
jgi:diguanylate cyclase (GGDEF)-like protein